MQGFPYVQMRVRDTPFDWKWIRDTKQQEERVLQDAHPLGCWFNIDFKGPGHAVLANFNTDQMVIELTKNRKIMAQNYRKTQTKHRIAKKGYEWTKLERIEMDCIWVNFDPYYFISKISFTQLENYSQLLCGSDFANERLLFCWFDV